MGKFEEFKSPEEKSDAGEEQKKGVPPLKDSRIKIEKNEDLMYLRLAEDCFKGNSFDKAVVLMESADKDIIEQRIKYLQSGSDEEKALAEDMYINKEWRTKAKETANEIREKKEDKRNWGVKVVMNKGNDGGVAFKAENPRFILSRAEEDFQAGKFFDAWWKTNYVEKKDIEKRKIELLQGSDADKELAQEMYVNDEWMMKERNKWHSEENKER